MYVSTTTGQMRNEPGKEHDQCGAIVAHKLIRDAESLPACRTGHIVSAHVLVRYMAIVL